MGYVVGVALIGLLGWFTYKQISIIVKTSKEKKQKKSLEKTQSDEKKED